MSVLRAWKALEEDLLSAKEFLGVALSWAAWQKNALYEALLDKKAPGATSQAVQGHDHIAAVDGGQGGRIIGRNMCAMGGMGQRGWAKVEVIESTVDTWISATPQYSGVGVPSYRAMISHSMVSPPGIAPAQPHLEAYLYIYAENDVDVRIVHEGTSFYSQTTSFSPNPGFYEQIIRVEKIPANGEGWNPYRLEIRSSSIGFYYIGFVNQSETPIVGGVYCAGTPPTPTQQIGS